MYKIALIIVAIVFVVSALVDLFSSPNFGGMSFSDKSFVIRFIFFIGLFIGGLISFAALRDWVISALLVMVALIILFSSC